MNKQVSRQFDRETLIKISKGALIAATGSAMLFLLGQFGAMEFSNPFLASFVVWFVPTATNLVKEYLKGE